MDYDKILLKLGEFGWWQKKKFFWLCIPAFVGGMIVLTTAFTAKIPKEFVCFDAECDTFEPTNLIDGFLKEKTLLNDKEDNCLALPLTKDESSMCSHNLRLQSEPLEAEA